MDRSAKVKALSGRMEEQEVDRVVLFSRDNVMYFTGFRLNRAASSILVVTSAGEPTYVVAQLDLERARRDCWVEQVISFPEDTPNYLDALGPLLAGSRRLGVERSCLTLAQADYLRALVGPQLDLVDVEPWVAEMRLRKDQQELELIRTAAAIADRAMEEFLREVSPGTSEEEAVGMIEYLLRREGSEGASFEPFVMSGENGWLPQRVGSPKPLRSGELILLDMGARYQGYCSDLTRTFALGDVSRKQRQAFAVARQAQQAALAAARPGVRADEVDRAARQLIEEAGLGPYFPHLTGHGVGVSIHEPPTLDQGVDTLLEPGMVVTVEPGVYVPGVGAARVEDLVVITEDGCRLLSTARRDLT
ncbi:MAG: M24 family metallopeptidase [Candidatus Bipolaricaulaceae bacterium]